MDILAVGDIISGIFTSASTWHYVQPAAGVEWILLSAIGVSAGRFRLYNGSSAPHGEQVFTTGTTAGNALSQSNNKVGITNTNYLGLWSDSSGPAYSAIQIK